MAKRGRPLGSKNKKTLKRESGMLIVEAKPNINKKSVRKQIREYLIEHGELSVDKAMNEFGWSRVRQYVNEFRYSGMSIKSVRKGKHITYVLDNTKVKVEKKAVDKKPTIKTGDKEFDKTVEEFNNIAEKIEEIKNKTEIKSVKTSLKETILDHLLEFGNISAIQAMKKYNCFSLPAIIKTLRSEGYKIKTSKNRCYKSLNTKVDRLQACAVYTLENKKRLVDKFTIDIAIDNEYCFFVPEFDRVFDNMTSASEKAQQIAGIITNRLNNVDKSSNTYNVMPIYGEGYRRYRIIKTTTTKSWFKTKKYTNCVATLDVVKIVTEE